MRTITDKFLFRDSTDASAVLRALAQGQLSGTSSITTEYEQALAALFRVEAAVAVSSGSAALHASLSACGCRWGDRIVIAAAAPIPSALPILTMGAVPVFVDNAPDSFAFDIDDLQKALRQPVRAVIMVHNWGYPLDREGVVAVLSGQSIPLIEDAAQAHGALTENGFVGTQGLFGCFSTHDRKILSTGEGGFVLTSSQSMAERIRQFVQLGYLQARSHGVNYKLSALQSALGLARVAYMETQVRQRAANAKLLLDRVLCDEISELPVPRRSRPNYYAVVLRLLAVGTREREKFVNALQARGIPSDIVKYQIKPLYMHPLFSRWKRKCPNAERLLSSITTIPCHPGLSEIELDYIANVVAEERHVLARAG